MLHYNALHMRSESERLEAQNNPTKVFNSPPTIQHQLSGFALHPFIRLCGSIDIVLVLDRNALSHVIDFVNSNESRCEFEHVIA